MSAATYASSARDIAFAAALCTLGGWIFHLAGMPLAWMLGAMTATALYAAMGGQRFIPPVFRTVSRPVVGVLAGSAFDSGTVASVLHWWDAIAVAVGQSLMVTVLGAVFFRKIGRFDRETAFFASVPAGLVEMSLLGSSLGGNARAIVMLHLVRIIVVLFSVPLIAQWLHGAPIARIAPVVSGIQEQGPVDWMLLIGCGLAGFGLSRLVPFAAGAMVFPMLLSALVHGLDFTRAAPPPLLVLVVQIAVGGVVGARFAGLDWRELRRTILVGFVWALVVMVISVLTAWLASRVVGEPYLWLLLALAPAGMVEMTILAYSIGLNVPFVVACQLARILFLQSVGPLLFDSLRFVARRRKRAGSDDADD